MSAMPHTSIQDQLQGLFAKLNARIDELREERREAELLPLAKARIQILGQISLLASERASLVLSLAQTGDFDAHLSMEAVVKRELEALLREHNLVYDEDSYLIWIPDGARFETLIDLENVLVEVLDPESALVSKAVKAPGKNKMLVREAIASEAFPSLVERILENGGRLEDFV